MQLSEFKAWFEGYTEGLEGAPTKAQFDRIKEKVKETTGTPISYPVFVDRYRPYYDRVWYGDAVGVAKLGQTTFSAQAFSALQNDSFDGHSAMYLAGKTDALLEN